MTQRTGLITGVSSGFGREITRQSRGVRGTRVLRLSGPNHRLHLGTTFPSRTNLRVGSPPFTAQSYELLSGSPANGTEGDARRTNRTWLFRIPFRRLI